MKELFAKEHTHHFSLPNARPKRHFLNYHLWLDYAEDGSTVALQLVPNDREPIGTGAFKQAYASQTLTLSLKDTPRSGSFDDTVLSKARNHTSQMLPREFEVLKHAHEIVSRYGGHIVSLPKLRREPYEGRGADHWQQDWYNGSLHDAIDRNKVPSSLSRWGTPDLPFQLPQVLCVLKDVVSTLASLHKGGMVHLDLHSKNIFLKVLPDKNIAGVVADFGTARAIGVDCKADFWGHGKKAYPTPFTDVFGAIVTLTTAAFCGSLRILEYVINRHNVVNGNAKDSMELASLNRQTIDLIVLFETWIYQNINNPSHVSRLKAAIANTTIALYSEFETYDKHNENWAFLRTLAFDKVIGELTSLYQDINESDPERKKIKELETSFKILARIYNYYLETIYKNEQLLNTLSTNPKLWKDIQSIKDRDQALESLHNIFPDAADVAKLIDECLAIFTQLQVT